jgi:hypothetical protein
MPEGLLPLAQPSTKIREYQRHRAGLSGDDVDLTSSAVILTAPAPAHVTSLAAVSAWGSATVTVGRAQAADPPRRARHRGTSRRWAIARACRSCRSASHDRAFFSRVTSTQRLVSRHVSAGTRVADGAPFRLSGSGHCFPACMEITRSHQFAAVGRSSSAVRRRRSSRMRCTPCAARTPAPICRRDRPRR